MAVKLARSRLTARSKGYAFIQFRYFWFHSDTPKWLRSWETL